VFIDGEPGTGKTAVAKAIHNARFHSDQPFVTINCSSSTEVFLERELFGHEEDNHSGAEEERLGKVGLAGEGTLFIDKVNSLSPRLQDKLMRLLRENEYTPLGATRPLQTGCRFVLASDIDLVDEVAAGRFSKDLFYSLGVFSIFIPPLRDRKEDIPLLVERLITKINKEACKNITRIQSDCMGLLVDYDWTGNVRQLENALMKAVVVAPGDVLNVSLLPEEITGGGKVPFSDSELALGKTLKDLECEHIHAVLTATGWHKGKACEILGISRPRLDRRIAEFGFVRD